MAVTTVTTKQIADNNVTNAKLAQMAASTMRGNNTTSTGNVLDLTVDQVNDLLGVWGAEYMSQMNLVNVLPIY